MLPSIAMSPPVPPPGPHGKSDGLRHTGSLRHVFLLLCPVPPRCNSVLVEGNPDVSALVVLLGFARIQLQGTFQRLQRIVRLPVGMLDNF
mmetsp:Transcript_115/g.246  ORF Transcript_115/g.246 Transcript_115/m.246 type:complete len:90 (+) Transcript_115:448-717(+)